MAQTYYRNAVMAALLGLASAVAAAQSYTAIDLGTLRPGSARIHAVNGKGEVVGESGDPHRTDTHSFFWSKSSGMVDMGTLAEGDFSIASGINDAGEVVGTSNTADSMRAFKWTRSSGLTALKLLPGTNASSAYAINSKGQIAGSCGSHAALWTEGAVRDLGTLGGESSEARGINNIGHVVGQSDTSEGQRAFAWTGASMRSLGALPGDTSSHANAINDSGIVVGGSEGANGMRAFIWTEADGMQEIPSLPVSSYSEAFGVNAAGQVVGQAGSPLGTRAFFWSKQTGSVDLNDAVSNLPEHVVLTGAFAINDKGQIVAFGVHNPRLTRQQPATLDSHLHSGATRVFLLSPIGTAPQ
jgi:probable HAF family extracellular repeat protein